MNLKNEYKELTFNTNKKANLTFIYLILVLFIYCYFGTFSFFQNTFSDIENLQYWKVIYHNFMAFILFFIFGLLYSKLVIKNKFQEIGLTKGNGKLSLIFIGIALAVTPIVGLASSLSPAMVSAYPMINLNTQWYFIALYFVSYLCYYIGWEFLFRGLGLFNTIEKFSPVTAILWTTLISALIHTSIGGFGKPMVETLSAIPAGLIFGYIAYKTKNVYTTITIHFLVGFWTDLMIYLM